MQNLVITKKGKELIAKLIAGNATAEFTKVKTSDYDYGSVVLEDLTDLYQIKQSVNVSQVLRKNTSIVEVQAAINNHDIEEGYYIKAVGLYAQSSDNGEFLYAISVSQHPDYMPSPSKTLTGVTFKLNTKVDNSEQVIIEVDPATSVNIQQLQDVITTVTAHSNKTINSEQGVHGFRFFNDTLQFYNAETSEWVDISTGGSGLPPSNVISPSVKVGNGKLTISWGDPSDTVVDGQTIVTWKGTKLVQKVGSYPENIKDGTLVVDNHVRNQYKNNGFVIENLQNNVTYYFQLFPYSDKKAVNENSTNRINGVPLPYKKMTVKINLNNSNPATCCSYHDDAVGMSAKSEAWDEFFGHYPCLFKNGHEVGKLKRDDFTKFENGGSADITSGNAGDVMIAFPRRGIKISTSDDVITVSMTDDPDDSEYKYYAHTRGSHRKDKFYIGAYKGYYDGSKLRSLSGKKPTTKQTIGTFRNWAKGNGTGYDHSAFYQLTFRQVMYLLKYKHLNSQVALGMGHVIISDETTNTGKTNTMGMDFGKTTGSIRMKLFGIEDFWGNIYEWVDGIYSDSVRNILVGTDNFNDIGSGYTNHGQGATSDIAGWLKKPQGTTETGFIVKEVNASETTYFCDSIGIFASNIAYFGGSFHHDNHTAGAFNLLIGESANKVDSVIGSRLMYL